MSTDPGPIAETLGRLAFEATKVRPLLPTYALLLLSALFPIFTAAHASLARPSSAAPPEKGREDAVGLGEVKDEVNDEVVRKLEGLTASDAIIFPLLAGATLSSLYLLIKWLEDPEWLNWCLGIYFSGIGTVFAMKFLKDALCLLRGFIFPLQYSAQGLLWIADPESLCYRAFLPPVQPSVHREESPFPGLLRRLPFPGSIQNIGWSLQKALYAKARLNVYIHKTFVVKSPIDILDFISFILAASLSAYNMLVDKPWYLTNFFGFSFCYGTLQLMSPTTGLTGTLMLVALFVYDIYFVFFTPMMVTVATTLDVPVKLLFPRSNGCVLPVGAAADDSEAMEAYKECLAKNRAMAMLGLGDIVIPGMMLAFALRYDLYLFYLRKQCASNEDGIKAKYQQVTGGWGERFWTSGRHWSPALQARRFPKVYFTATMIGYLMGMVTTLVAMQISGQAQPALLYLVPGVSISLWGTALVRGDIKLLWHYSEAEDEESSSNNQTSTTRQSSKTSELRSHPNQEVDSVSTKQVDEIPQTEQKTANVEGISGVNALRRKTPKNSAAEATIMPTKSTSIDSDNDSKPLFLVAVYFDTSRQPAASVTNAIRDTTTSAKEGESKELSNDNSSHPATGAASPREETTTIPKSCQNGKDNGDAEGQQNIIPHVAADNAVLARLRKEVSASSAGVADAPGSEPPMKRSRKA